MHEFNRITHDPAVMGGKLCLRGMRVTVESVLALLDSGKSREQVLDACPGLQGEDIDAVVAYAAWRARRSDVIPRGDAGSRRYLAAVVDQLAAILIAVPIAKLVPEKYALAQGLTLVATFLGYFFLFESLFGATPGKWFFGLRVCDQRGARCSPEQAAVRTLLRIVEVNPLFGALPAVLLIVFSRRKRRLGDMLGGTLVVSREVLRAWHAHRLAKRTCARCGEPAYFEEARCPMCDAVT